MAKVETLTPEDVRECVGYDPATGTFTWLPRSDASFGNAKAAKIYRTRFEGRPAFTHIGSQGYLCCRIKQVLITAHRAAFAVMTGQWPLEQVDHISGDRQDNRWANLRLADQMTNSRNMAMPKRNTSGRVGVSFDRSRQKWFAQGRAGNRQFNLGRFDTFEGAAAARVKFERENNFHPNHGRAQA